MKFTLGALLLLPLGAVGSGQGLNQDARDELVAAGVDKYLGQFPPILPPTDLGDGWKQYTFNPEYTNPTNPLDPQPAGPVCITGAQYFVYVREGSGDDKNKVLINLQGGGACWQDSYRCFPIANSADQTPPYPGRGIADFDNDDNPFKDYTIVTLPHCDGSVFIGDNDVPDLAYAAFILAQSGQIVAPIRYHRGVRNLSAGMDLAKVIVPDPSKVVIAGSSAGGVGAQALAPFLARFLFGNAKDLLVLNDSGPIMFNLEDTVGVQARANEWQFAKFFPESCEDCSALSQGTAIMSWRLENDVTVKDAFFTTDGDYVIRFTYLNYIPGVDYRETFRDIQVGEHGILHCAFPHRYRRFIVSDDGDHAVFFQDSFPVPDPFYTKTADEGGKSVVLNEWVDAFVNHRSQDWPDLVEPFVFVYPNAEIQDIPPPFGGFGTKCTNCWCNPEDGPDGECPELGNREISYSPATEFGLEVITKFKSFTLTGEKPTYNPPGCQPYPAVCAYLNTVLNITTPACTPPISLGDHAVCAYKYDTDHCSTRSSYSLDTYENAHKADMAGAIIIHEKDCGVCSNAGDLTVNMNPLLLQESVTCALLLTNPNPIQGVSDAIACFKNLGFSDDCATLWTNNALNSALSSCTSLCPPNIVEPPNNPQTCDLNDCIACDEEKSGDIFTQYSGLTRRRSGIITPIIRNCTSIANIGQDPCATENPKPASSSKSMKSGKGQGVRGSKSPRQSKGGSDKCRGAKGSKPSSSPRASGKATSHPTAKSTKGRRA